MSKAFRQVWRDELRRHPELFRTTIISTHESRDEAFIKEGTLMKALNTGENPLYINQSSCATTFVHPKETNPFKGGGFKSRKHSEEARRKISEARKRQHVPCSPEKKAKLSIANSKR